ncbi:hypothetical protein VTN77DRAFT_7867 [Rasamsonia byssochlamydoides]|uniref:uncharacterized protein n=1 Tax=Rasamsonia byssochlamydoides TaxID=89139 RepID=UPI0037425B3C
MGSFATFLLAYILGGLTFIPLILALIALHAYLTLKPPSTSPSTEKDEESTSILQRPNDDQYSLKSGTDVLAEEFQRTRESDVAAGYFAVCREYVPGGVNGKPPERTTPAGEVVATESPSVYQAMYRSIFDRKQPPSIDPAKTNGKNFKKARNVFYIVLRHGHLMLYDDAEQIEVRYVISLAHHDVSIYGGGDEIPEGELWIKRNAICLSRKEDSISDLRGMTPPFYLFSESQSAKEDFYFALLKNQERIPDSPNSPPTQLHYDVKDIVTLVQRLHSSEEHLQTRWINAIVGRLFLALYKTPEMQEFVRKKVTKKISRVKKPTFISKISLQKIDMGHGAPFITNPRLKDLTIDGDCTVETDVNYSGHFRLEISATARIDLGQRFKTREVDLVLAVVLKKLTGHVLVRFKPPPSNRIWFCFATMPDMVMSIEPIVSSRQITYGIILRAIESRIREVVAESLVYPFWDDVPFLDTSSQPFRGGIWERDVSKASVKTEIPDESESQDESALLSEGDSFDILKTKDDRTMSMPEFPESPHPVLKSRKSSKSSDSTPRIDESASSSAVDKRTSSSPPRAIRSRTFSNVAGPVVTPDHGKVDKVGYESGKNEKKKNATSSMIEISTRSQSNSLAGTPVGSPPKEQPSLASQTPRNDSTSSTDSIDGRDHSESLSDVPQRPPAVHTGADSPASPSPGSISRSSTASDETKRSRTLEGITKSFTSSVSSGEKRPGIGSIGSATAAAAKKWGWNVLGKGDQGKVIDPAGRPGTPDHPIGRGRPLPPPGTPLPPPERFGFRSNPISIPRRKPVPPPVLPERSQEENMRPVPKPPLPKRKSPPSQESKVIFTDEVLVVEAPQDSEPNSPGPGRELHAVHAVKTENIPPAASDSQLHPQQTSDDAQSDSGFEQIPSLSEDGAMRPASSSSTSPDHETTANDRFRPPQNVVL